MIIRVICHPKLTSIKTILYKKKFTLDLMIIDNQYKKKYKHTNSKIKRNNKLP